MSIVVKWQILFDMVTMLIDHDYWLWLYHISFELGSISNFDLSKFEISYSNSKQKYFGYSVSVEFLWCDLICMIISNWIISDLLWRLSERWFDLILLDWDLILLAFFWPATESNDSVAKSVKTNFMCFSSKTSS